MVEGVREYSALLLLLLQLQLVCWLWYPRPHLLCRE